MVLVSGKVPGINDQVMISVQFPELAVQHIKVLIGEEGELLVDVNLCLQATDCLREQSRWWGRQGEEEDHT